MLILFLGSGYGSPMKGVHQVLFLGILQIWRESIFCPRILKFNFFVIVVFFGRNIMISVFPVFREILFVFNHEIMKEINRGLYVDLIVLVMGLMLVCWCHQQNEELWSVV